MTGPLRSELQARLENMAGRHKVPGASLAVLTEDRVLTATCGVLNIETGVEVTPDSVFQIGSITKVLTTTLVLQLADAGMVGLDTPVADVLVDFALADATAQRQITIRHLLSHTSGIEGDHFVDTGRDDGAVARYVETCAKLGTARGEARRDETVQSDNRVTTPEGQPGPRTAPCPCSGTGAARLRASGRPSRGCRPKEIRTVRAHGAWLVRSTPSSAD